MAKLGEVCKVSPSTKNIERQGAWLLNLDMVEQQTGRVIEYKYVGEDDLNGSIIQFDTENVLYSKLRPNLNKVVLPPKDGFSTSELLPLRPDARVLNRDYLAVFLRSDSFVTWAVSKTAGAKMPRLGTKDLMNAEIPVPTIEQQKKIAEKFKKLEQLISLRKQQLAKLDELVKARFVEMFGNIIRNDKSWPIHNFSDIASSRLGKMLDAKQQTGKYSYPYLANFNVQWFNFNVDNLNQMDFNEAEQKEFELRDGDLLVCEGGEIGRCAVWHNEIQPCFFQKALHRVRCNRQLVQPDYLAWWFKYNCNHGGFAEIAGAKATIAHLPGIKLKQLQVALPPLSLQNEFAAFVERVDQQKQTVQQSLEKLELMKKALMQEYFG
ncbi:restriction endonuclease subunit S [Faecalibacterium prausnitzii]|uniref:restriction endonuclease subunit S n=1 Tax=Faecalibacterium TaxID=216851 RepID=UPI0032AF83CD